jgi:hypothetical protein
MLSEVSQVQKHKGPMFSLTHRRRERKRAWEGVNNVKIHCICVGRWQNEKHWKLLNNRVWGIKSKGQ